MGNKKSLGSVEVFDLSKDGDIDKLQGLFQVEETTEIEDVSAYAYGATSTCSDSCGSSTFCC